MVRSVLIAFTLAFYCCATASAGLILTGTSYEQNFDSVVLPDNWTVRTGASETVLGNTQVLNVDSPTWASGTARFFSSASVTGRTSGTSTTDQNAATDRALSVRQGSAFGDPGAAFVLEIENTLGFQDFSVSLNAEMQDVEDRTTTWRVDFGTGTSPSTFTSIGNIDLGTEFGETSNLLSFGTQLDNLSGPVWIRVVTVTAAAGSGFRDTFGIDDFRLDFSITAVPEPSSMLLLGLAGFSVGVGRRWRRKKMVV